MTDVAGGDARNDERLAFVFDRTRVHPSGIAAELVVPPERLERMGPNVLREQFARTPYAVSFRRGPATFILVTTHVIFGDVPDDRIPELQEIADWMRDWAPRSNRYHHNLLLLGDFNIDRQGSPLFDAFTSSGLTIPDVLVDLPRTVFDDPGDSSDDNYYDQIAFFTSGPRAASISRRTRTRIPTAVACRCRTGSPTIFHCGWSSGSEPAVNNGPCDGHGTDPRQEA